VVGLFAVATEQALADRYMAGHALSALCGYRLDLGHEIVNELASLHGTGSSGGTGFTLFGCADGAIGLGGRYDPTSVTVLRRLLTRIRRESTTGPSSSTWPTSSTSTTDCCGRSAPTPGTRGGVVAALGTAVRGPG
jgi:hypothetical protein